MPRRRLRAQLNALRAVPVDTLATRTLVTASSPGGGYDPGRADYTSRPLDVALQQDGWLVVQAAMALKDIPVTEYPCGPDRQLTIQDIRLSAKRDRLPFLKGQITIAADGTILSRSIPATRQHGGARWATEAGQSGRQ